MSVQIRRVGAEWLPRYAEVPIRFTVRSMFRVETVNGGLDGLALVEEEVDPPYVKDYDAQDAGEPGVLAWPEQFDVSKWSFFVALEGDRPVAGAAVAIDTPGLNMLQGRRDLAVLWDIRVHPDRRRRGIGARLFQRAASWAQAKGCQWFKVETQNVNVPACRFYVRQGCTLGAIDRYGYAGHPLVAHEAMLLWYLEL
jgi:GNAT superfamily N-acetyltransferase